MSELRSLRLRAQCLAPRRRRRALVEVVQAVSGVNAQLPSAMALSLRARVQGLTLQDIETCRVGERALVRTWCMRGTMHLLAAKDIDWLLSAIPPAQTRSGWRWLERRGGLKGERAQQVLDAAHQVLRAKGPMTRRALMDVLAKDYGEPVRRAAAGLVHLNGLLGRVCFGPQEGGEPTYAALDKWLGRKVRVGGKPDHGELARRYLRGYGPATPEDFAAWWGMGITEAKRAWTLIGDELVQVHVDGETNWMLRTDAPTLEAKNVPSRRAILLPAFDTYLLGYRNREFAVPKERQKSVFHGGEIVPTILIDGCAAGTWRYEPSGKQLRIRVTPFTAFAKPIRELVALEVEDIGRFLGLAATLGFD